MKKILIIDDDMAFREVMRVGADRQKFEVVCAGDGVEGLKALENFTPDAILLDIEMPHMNGIEFLEKLRAHENRNEAPIIITSNNPSSANITRAGELGVHDFFVKSNESVASIMEIINKALAKKYA